MWPEMAKARPMPGCLGPGGPHHGPSCAVGHGTGHRLLQLRACVSSAGRTHTEEVTAGTTRQWHQCRCVLAAVLTPHARALATGAGTAQSQSVRLYSTETAWKRLGPKCSAAAEKMTSRGDCDC